MQTKKSFIDSNLHKLINTPTYVSYIKFHLRPVIKQQQIHDSLNIVIFHQCR